MNRYETILRHVGIWTLYAVYFFIVNKLGNSRLSILTVLISLPIFMFVYYGVSHSLNVYLYNRRYVGAILMLLFIYGVVFLTVYFLTYGWGGASGLYSDYFTASSNFDGRKFMQSFLMLIGNFSIFAFLEYQYRLKIRSNQRAQAERMWRQRYEYTTLAQQVSPHLLANVFQSLEHQLNKVPPALGKQIDGLYKLMQYFMNSSLPDGPSSVILAEEIQATRRFIDIYEELYSKKSSFIWEVKGNTQGATIPATGLVTLVSNVFKHGDPFNSSTPPTIRVSVNREGYTLFVSNQVTPRKKIQESHGVGIENLRRRLEYVFAKKFKLVHSSVGGNYHVHLAVYF